MRTSASSSKKNRSANASNAPLLTFDYTGSITLTPSKHVKMIRAFGRAPTPTEFVSLFEHVPDELAKIFWVPNIDLTGHLTGLARLDTKTMVEVISRMMSHKNIATDIAPYLDLIDEDGSMPKFMKKARAYFGIAPETRGANEFAEAVSRFHTTGEIATGLENQAAYDDYIHEVMQTAKDEEEQSEMAEVCMARDAEDDRESRVDVD